MKSIYIVLLCLIITGLNISVKAQKNWRWQNPWPQGNTLTSATSPDPNTIVFVGLAGTIIKSKDLGQTFEVLPTGIKTDLYAISFFDSNNGMAVGEDGVIIRTKDCGKTWENLISGRNDTLRGVSMLSDKIIIAVGDTGTILKSFDGGDSWNYQPIPGFKPNLNKVFFPDGGTGWGTIVGDSFPSFGGPPIVFTEDTGANWTPYGGGNPSLANKFFNSVWMPKGDPDKAVLVGNQGTIISTTTKGANWSQPIVPVTVNIEDVWFFDDNNGFATGPEGVLLRTKDCGNTWSLITTPINRDLSTVIFPKDSTGFFGGGFGLIFKTPDGGASFEPIQTGFFPNLTDVAFLDDSFGIAVGAGGSILRTTNSGNDWLAVPPVTFDPIEAVTGTKIPTGGNRLWFAGGTFGSFGRIFSSEDSGAVWKTQPVAAFSKFFDITFYDSLNGFAVGLNGIIYCTRNGGTTWTAKTSGSNKWLLGVDMTNDSTGYVVGGEGTILKSTNFGDNWTPLSSGTDEWLTSVSFLDDSFGIAAGNHGVILRTEDAGNSWKDISPSGITFDFTDVSLFRGFNSSNRMNKKNTGIVAVGYGGTIVYSPNGGDTWIEQNSLTKHPLTACFFSDSISGTVVGHYGTILRTDSLQTTSVGLEDYLGEKWKEDSPLGQNYPNPFSESTSIPFSVSYRAPIDLRIFDLQGKQVDRLIHEELRPGTYEYEWEPKHLPSGIYVYRLQIGFRSYSEKLILNR